MKNLKVLDVNQSYAVYARFIADDLTFSMAYSSTTKQHVAWSSRSETPTDYNHGQYGSLESAVYATLERINAHGESINGWIIDRKDSAFQRLDGDEHYGYILAAPIIIGDTSIFSGYNPSSDQRFAVFTQDERGFSLPHKTNIEKVHKDNLLMKVEHALDDLFSFALSVKEREPEILNAEQHYFRKKNRDKER